MTLKKRCHKAKHAFPTVSPHLPVHWGYSQLPAPPPTTHTAGGWYISPPHTGVFRLLLVTFLCLTPHFHFQDQDFL